LLTDIEVIQQSPIQRACVCDRYVPALALDPAIDDKASHDPARIGHVFPDAPTDCRATPIGSARSRRRTRWPHLLAGTNRLRQCFKGQCFKGQCHLHLCCGSARSREAVSR